MKVRMIILLFLCMPLTVSAAAEVVYVSSVKAKLLSDPDFKSKAILMLKKGEQITVLGQKGPWLNVQTPDQKTGWLSKFLTKPTPPNDRVTVLPGDEGTILKDVRRRTSTITTAAAARGLADVSKGSKADLYVSDMAAVEYMESFQIAPRELKEFADAISRGGK